MTESETDPPRWVKAFLLAAVLFVLSFIALHVGSGFSNHGHRTGNPTDSAIPARRP